MKKKINKDATMLTIGQVAKRAGVKNGTIRFYERQGLINNPSRTDSGYRIYPPGVITRIKFIKNAQAFGFTLTEIRRLLRLSTNVNMDTCKVIQQYGKQKIIAMQERMKELDRMCNKMKNLLQICEDCDIPNCCPILESFENEIV